MKITNRENGCHGFGDYGMFSALYNKIARNPLKLLYLWLVHAIMKVQKRPKSCKNFALAGVDMYKFKRYCQLGLADFNQLAGLKIDSENCWVREAATILWKAIEEKYTELFPGD